MAATLDDRFALDASGNETEPGAPSLLEGLMPLLDASGEEQHASNLVAIFFFFFFWGAGGNLRDEKSRMH